MGYKNLSKSIQAEWPDIPPELLNDVIRTQTEFNLDWIPHPHLQTGALFIARDLEIAVGKRGDQFNRSWKTFQAKLNHPDANQRITWDFFEVYPGKTKLTGNLLKLFKANFKHRHQRDLGSINKLWVVNWPAMFSYLNDRVTYPTPSLLSPKSIVSPTGPLQIKLVEPPKRKAPPDLSEDMLSQQLVLLSTYGPHPFRREVQVINTYSESKTRRFDLVRTINQVTEVYELKIKPLTAQVIAETLGEKGYLQLAQQLGSNIHFNFVTPYLEPSAERLLENLPQVHHLNLQQLINHLKNEIYGVTPKDGRWFVEQRVLPQFESLLTTPLAAAG